MDAYKELKLVFRKEKSTLYERIRELEDVLEQNKRIRRIIDELSKYDIIDLDFDSLYRLKKYFPNLADEFAIFKRFIQYHAAIKETKNNALNTDNFIRDIELISRLYGVPPKDKVEDIKKVINVTNNIRNGKINQISKEDMDLFLGRENRGIHALFVYAAAICCSFAEDLLKKVDDELTKAESIDSLKEILECKSKIALIDKYNAMFSNDELLVKFQSPEDIREFTDLINSLLSIDECIKVLNNIRIEQEKEVEEQIDINFDNLDMSLFNPMEQQVIKELKEIIEEEDLVQQESIFVNLPIEYEARFMAYNDTSMNNILLDVENNLLNKIYEKKDEIIKIFKLIINLYQKYSIRKVREEEMNELLQIKNDFNGIISFINKTYLDKTLAFNEEKIINTYISTIESEYLPLLQELIDSDYYSDEYYDEEFNNAITDFKNIIKKWKKIMTLSYQDDDSFEDIKENTDNLVFCLTDDIDLSDEGIQKEFLGTIESLELMSSQELKKRSGRKGMSKLRKSTESNREKDFIAYLETKYKVHLHFIPYRYSSESNYRTGLIKFEPSAKVKEFLEERYGLSKQSAYYGIFKIITVIRSDHSEYAYLENYILNNFIEIEEIAKLFASEEPDFEKLTELIDKFLKIKHDMQGFANANIKNK